MTLVLIFFTGRTATAAEGIRPARVPNPFFAFCMDTHDAKKRSLAQQAALVKELGFDGLGHVGLDDVPERLETADDAGLRLFLVGLRVDLSVPEQSYEEQLSRVLPLLEGRGAAIYVTIGGLPPEAPSGGAIAVPILRQIADRARPFDVRVALYPHTGDWLVRVAHAVRLAAQVDRPNLGVMFTLCHWLKNEDEAGLLPLLRSARPYLLLVSINGADIAGRSDQNWDRLIQPLDRGTFDVYRFLKALKEVDYTGPIGLMCYGIRGDARDHLARSMVQWRGWQDRLQTDAVRAAGSPAR